MREYLEAWRLWLVAAVLTPGWLWVQQAWSGFALSDPVVGICLLWLADLGFGMAAAVLDGRAHPDDPTRGLCTSRILRSFRKLCGYLAGMALASIIVHAGHGTAGPALAGGCLETVLLVKEFLSAARNMGKVFDLPFVVWFADELEQKTIKIKRETKP